MMLGKRAEMKRRPSMTEFTLDFSCAGEATYQPLDHQSPLNAAADQPYSSAISPRPPPPQRHNSADFAQTAPFLSACSLCKRRLIPGRDIYMYRGDSAFCSVECRQQQMNQDERKDKCSMASKKEAAARAGGGSRVSATG